MRIGVDGRRIRNNKVAFSNLSGIVWTRPKINVTHVFIFYDIGKSLCLIYGLIAS